MDMAAEIACTPAPGMAASAARVSFNADALHHPALARLSENSQGSRTSFDMGARLSEMSVGSRASFADVEGVNTVPQDVAPAVENDEDRWFSMSDRCARLVFGAVAAEPDDERRGLDHLVIHPYNRLKFLFDMVVTCFMFAVGLASPLQAAYVLPQLDPLVDVASGFFVFDIVVQFFTGYEECGVPELRLAVVAWRYARSWLLVDVIGALPWYLMLRSSTIPSVVHLSYWMWLLRIPRTYRALASLRLETPGTVIRVVWSLSFWLWMAHLFGCAWFVLGWQSRCTEAPAFGGMRIDETWIDASFPQLQLPECAAVRNATAAATDATASSGGSLNGRADDVALLSRMHIVSMWIKCLYWAISTMSSLGYGDGPRASTEPEFAMSIGCQLVGACLYAFIFGNIAQLIQKIDHLGTKYKAQQERINEFVNFHSLSAELRTKLHRYNKFLFAVNRGFDVGQIAKALPMNLRRDVMFQMHRALITSVPLFDVMDQSFVNGLVCVLQPQVLLRGDCAFRIHEVGDEMYFVQRGRMQMVDASMEICYNNLHAGSFFGELGMLIGAPRTATALAASDSVLFYMNRADFNAVAERHPNIHELILRKAHERLQRVAASNKEMARAAKEVMTHISPGGSTPRGPHGGQRGSHGTPSRHASSLSRTRSSLARRGKKGHKAAAGDGSPEYHSSGSRSPSNPGSCRFESLNAISATSAVSNEGSISGELVSSQGAPSEALSEVGAPVTPGPRASPCPIGLERRTSASSVGSIGMPASTRPPTGATLDADAVHHRLDMLSRDVQRILRRLESGTGSGALGLLAPTLAPSSATPSQPPVIHALSRERSMTSTDL